jgi:hypothetical protein
VASEDRDEPLEVRPCFEHLSPPLEPVALPHKRVHDIHLDAGVPSKVGDCTRRPNVGKHEVVVVKNGDRAFR